jgi:hypothetical protein
VYHKGRTKRTLDIFVKAPRTLAYVDFCEHATESRRLVHEYNE